jgi:predicted nucleic acid-binding protein
MFISLLTGKDPKRVEVIRRLIEQEKKGFIQIVTSTFTIAEIRPLESDKTANPDHFQTALELMESERLEIRAVTPHIGREAQKIGMKFPALSPADCTHIATAVDARVIYLFTFDGIGTKRRKPDMMIAHTDQIGDPPLKIREPFVPEGPLFAKPE